MADEPSWEEIFSTEPTPESPAPASVYSPQSRREAREHEAAGSDSPPVRPRANRYRGRVDEHGLPPRPKKRRRFTWLWVLLSFVVVIGAGSTAVWFIFEPQIKQVLGIQAPVDYTDSGTGSVVINITNGQTGGDVAKTLATSGVTKTYEAFYSLLLTKPDVTFAPGSYRLRNRMSARSALTALQDPANKVSTRISFPEGTTLKGVIAKLADLSQNTGVTAEQLTAAAADYKTFGLPAQAPSLEGYLFPAVYTLVPKMTAHQILQSFVSRMFTSLDTAGVAPADRHRVLTLAALTQKEGGSDADFLKVARVWDNRIAAGMNLQSDATVSYGSGGTTVNTTAAQRADKSNLYNTYANPGLPIGPIANPGDAAISATLHPAAGGWLYFVVVNCSTRETAFSVTFAQQQAATAQLGAWLKANPGGCN